MPTKSRTVAPMMRPPDFSSPMPIRCPSRIVVPMAMELTKLEAVIMSWEPTDTPETSCVAANLPTISRSTAP